MNVPRWLRLLGLSAIVLISVLLLISAVFNVIRSTPTARALEAEASSQVNYGQGVVQVSKSFFTDEGAYVPNTPFQEWDVDLGSYVETVLESPEPNPVGTVTAKYSPISGLDMQLYRLEGEDGEVSYVEVLPLPSFATR